MADRCCVGKGKSISHNNFAPGKLPHEFLHQMLTSYTSIDARVLLSAKIGEDATVIDMGETCLLAKTDPITFVSEHIGYYAVHVNANDICCMGGEPKWFLATLLLPELGSTPELVEAIFRQIHETCQKEKIAFCGGHSEVTLGLDRPIVVGQMLGEVAKDRLLLKKNARPGDRLIVAREVPIEGTAIIAREKEDELQQLYSPELVKRCKNLLFKPGLSVRSLCRLAVEHGEVHALHDPTEGGIFTALHELATAAQLGLAVQEAAIPLLPEGKLLCDHYDLDPFGCISSGSLLIVASEDSSEKILAALGKNKIVAADIGSLVNKQAGEVLITEQGAVPLPVYGQDEIVKIFV